MKEKKHLYLLNLYNPHNKNYEMEKVELLLHKLFKNLSQ